MAASSLTSGPQPAPNARGQGLLFQGAKPYAAGVAGVAELVDALDLGSSAARRGGSSPLARTIKRPGQRLAARPDERPLLPDVTPRRLPPPASGGRSIATLCVRRSEVATRSAKGG